MKFTLSWLKTHLDTDASLEAICERLTLIGLEVEHVDTKAEFKPFVIAKILTAERSEEHTSDSSHQLRSRMPSSA